MSIKYRDFNIKNICLRLFLFSSFCIFADMPPMPEHMPSPEELEAMVADIEKNDPELFKLLQEEGRRILIENGIDPDSFEQPKTDAGQETPKAPTQAPERAKKPTEFERPVTTGPAIRGMKEIESLISALIESLNSMRLKAHVNTSIARLLDRFKRELDDLLYYLPVLKNKPIVSYLATAAYTPFYNRLKSFAYTILDLEQQLLVDDLYAEKHDTPYHILSVRAGSDEKQIEAAYKKLMKAKDPKELKKRLKDQEFSKREQEFILQENDLQIKTIKEAYDVLKDTNTKKRLDREHEIRISQRLSGGAISKELLAKIGKACTDFIYQQRALEDIKKLIAEYAPEAAKNKAKIEEELQQERERVQEAKKRPQQPSPRGPMSPRTYYPEARSGNSSGYAGGGYNPDYGQYNQPYNQPTGEKPKSSPAGKSGDKKDKESDKDKDKKDKDEKENKDKKSDDKSKKTKSKNAKEKSFKDHIKDLVAALTRTQNALFISETPDLIIGKDPKKARAAYATLELDQLLAKLDTLHTWLIDPKQHDYFATDKDKKEAAQEWEATILQRAKSILEKILFYLPKQDDPIKPDEAITQLEVLEKDYYDLLVLLKNISLKLGIVLTPKRSGAAPKPLYALLNQQPRTDSFYALLIAAKKEIQKGDAADLKALHTALKKIYSQTSGLDPEQKEQQKVLWINKILLGSTLEFLKKLSAPKDTGKEKERSVIDPDAQEEPDLIDTILLNFKNISQFYGLIDAAGKVQDDTHAEILELITKPRRIAA